jgi:PAS domain-containing protein
LTARTLFARLHDDPGFRADASGLLVLDRDLVIRAANDAVLAATSRVAADILDLPVFEAYPGNPDDVEGNTQAVFQDSFERVLGTGRPRHLLVQRYDVSDPREEGRYVPRYWSPRQEPVIDDGAVVGVVSRVVPVPAPQGSMARQGVDPEKAFRLLVRMSNDTNVRVADVARALVYRTGGA